MKYQSLWCKLIWYLDRTRSTSGDGVSKERSPSASARGRERNPSAAVRLARQSAKDQMRAAGMAKEKGEADMEQFVKASCLYLGHLFSNKDFPTSHWHIWLEYSFTFARTFF